MKKMYNESLSLDLTSHIICLEKREDFLNLYHEFYWYKTVNANKLQEFLSFYIEIDDLKYKYNRFILGQMLKIRS